MVWSLSCDWSHGSLDLIEKWSDHRIIFGITLYALVIRCFIVAPRSVYKKWSTVKNSLRLIQVSIILIFRHIRIAIALLVVPFIPSSNIITVGFVIADRVLYIPSLGFCLLISIGVQSILPKYPKIVEIFYLMLVALFVMRSNERSIDWQNNLNLFQSAVRVCPNNAKIFYNLAQINAANGNHKKSLEYNLRANELKPNNIGTLINLGNAYRHIGNPQMALQYHKKVTHIE